MIYHKCFCYNSVKCQNFQKLIVDKDRCCVVDRAVVFGAVGARSSPTMLSVLKHTKIVCNYELTH